MSRAALAAAALLLAPLPVRAEEDPMTPEPPGSLDGSCAIDLAWLPDGSRLMVGGAFLLDPDSGARTPLKFSTRARYRSGSHAHHAISFSPSTKKVLVVEEDAFRFGPINSDLRDRTVLPKLIPSETSPRTVGFPISDRKVFLEQSDRQGGDPECRIWEAKTHEMTRPLGGCLSGDFAELYDLKRGPSDWVVLYSAGEGHPAALIVRWDPRRGQRPSGAPEIDLYPFGPLTAHPIGSGTALFATPCVLGEKERPCVDLENEATWSLYRWKKGRGFERIRSGLPPGATPDPSGKRVAWVTADEVCVSAIEHGKPHCAPLRR